MGRLEGTQAFDSEKAAKSYEGLRSSVGYVTSAVALFDRVSYYIKNIKKLNQQPEFVYDISVKDTQNFMGGDGLVCLHNSIGEEGLDIPEVNAVYFYEPIPSAIRKIQRAGRTARLKPGKLVILMTRDTRDIAYHYASTAREKKMYKNLEDVKKGLGEKTLREFT